jgi:hypothetical protein
VGQPNPAASLQREEQAAAGHVLGTPRVGAPKPTLRELSRKPGSMPIRMGGEQIADLVQFRRGQVPPLDEFIDDHGHWPYRRMEGEFREKWEILLGAPWP